jgi:hypothetical protein
VPRRRSGAGSGGTASGWRFAQSRHTLRLIAPAEATRAATESTLIMHGMICLRLVPRNRGAAPWSLSTPLSRSSCYRPDYPVQGRPGHRADPCLALPWAGGWRRLVETIEEIAAGFGEIMAEVGQLIGFGVLIGALLHATGALHRLVDMLVRVVGHPTALRADRDPFHHPPVDLGRRAGGAGVAGRPLGLAVHRGEWASDHPAPSVPASSLLRLRHPRPGRDLQGRRGGCGR